MWDRDRDTDRLTSLASSSFSSSSSFLGEQKNLRGTGTLVIEEVADFTTVTIDRRSFRLLGEEGEGFDRIASVCFSNVAKRAASSSAIVWGLAGLAGVSGFC